MNHQLHTAPPVPIRPVAAVRPASGRSRRRLLQAVIVVLLLAASTNRECPAQAGSETTRFQLADTYLRAGQYDRAISLLEDLYSGNPEYAFYNKLKQAYENTKQYDKAIGLIDGRMESDDNQPVLLSERARILYLADRVDEAFETWDMAVARAPDDAANYRMVYQSLFQVREFDRAIALLEEARTKLGDTSLFRRDLGALYTQTSQYDKAMSEYVGLLREDPRHLATIKSNIARFADQEGVVQESVAVLEEAVREEPLNADLRELLGWLYVESGLFDRAFDTYRAIDRLQNHQGRTLFSFAGQALSARSYEVAEQAFSEILQRYPTNAIAPEALRGLAEVNVAWARQLGEHVSPNGDRSDAPHYEKALDLYDQFLERYPVSQSVPYVLLDSGRLLQEVFHDFENARTRYDEVLASHKSSSAADEAEFEKGRLNVTLGQLEDARLEFGRIADRLHTGDLAEEARYEAALVHFYRGEFEAAKALVGALKENTSNDTANDAIGLRVLLIENEAPDSLNRPMQLFAHAMLLQRQLKLKEALANLDSLLVDFSGNDLTDDAAFLKAQVLEQQFDFEAANAAFLQLALQFPKSFLADRSLFRAARIQETQMDDVDGALESYSRLLVDYPGSLLAAQARERIRILRGDNV